MKARLTGGVRRGIADVYQRQRVNNTADLPMMLFELFTDERGGEREALSQHSNQLENPSARICNAALHLDISRYPDFSTV